MEETILAMVTFPTPLWIDELKSSYHMSPKVKELLSKLEKGENVPKGYNLHQGQFLNKGKILLVPQSPFQEKVLHYVHQDP